MRLLLVRILLLFASAAVFGPGRCAYAQDGATVEVRAWGRTASGDVLPSRAALPAPPPSPQPEAPPVTEPSPDTTAVPEWEQPPPLVTVPLTLQEAIHLALSHSDVIRTLSGIESVTGYDPLIERAASRAELGDFDPLLRMEFEGSQIDEPPESFFGPGIETQTRRDEADLAAEISKKWSPGTVTRVGYEPPLGYLYLPRDSASGTFNPAYSSRMVFEIRQPLLRGFGRPVNLAPIRIAQARVDQSRWEIERATMSKVRGTEEAYWNLHAAHVAWQAIESVIPIAEESVRLEELRFKAERTTYADVARAKFKLESLRQQSAQGRNVLRQTENQLRALMGVPADLGAALLPVDAPREDPLTLDLDAAVGVALTRRPDLKERRMQVQRLDWQRIVAANSTLPQLDARYRYRASGLASRQDDALAQMGTLDYSDWTVGVEFSVPLWNRRARSELLARDHSVARERALLREYERQVSYDIAAIAAELDAAWRQSRSALRQVRETQEWLRLANIRYRNPSVADASRNVLVAALDDFQTAMQAYIDSLSAAAQSLANYNIALARLSQTMGTSLDLRRIEFADCDPAAAIALTPSESAGLEPPVQPHAETPHLPFTDYRAGEEAPSASSSGHAPFNADLGNPSDSR